jgi:single-strand DNA-binding protein
MLNLTAYGVVGKDPEQRDAGNSTVTNFSLAVNRKTKDEETTTWINCAVWGNRGDVVMDYVKKGMRLVVCGQAHHREFERKDGSTGISLELNVNDFSLPPKKETEETAPAKKRSRF